MQRIKKQQYSITVIVNSTNYQVILHQQGVRKSNTVCISAWFFLRGDKIIRDKTKPARCHRQSEYWNGKNYKHFVGRLFRYWVRTKHAWSRQYTDWWHVRNHANGIEYKMYDCSAYFVYLCSDKFWDNCIFKPCWSNNYLRDAHSHPRTKPTAEAPICQAKPAIKVGI